MVNALFYILSSFSFVSMSHCCTILAIVLIYISVVHPLENFTLLMYLQKKTQKSSGRIRCSVLLPPRFEVEDNKPSRTGGRKSGFIQISPTREGPWTTVRLNYAAPAACWRLGNDVVASEVSIKDGNRYVTIRSLASVRNNTDFTLDLCLQLRASDGDMRPLEDATESEEIQTDVNRFEKDEFFETEKYNPTIGWVNVNVKSDIDHSDDVHSHQVRGLTLALKHT